MARLAMGVVLLAVTSVVLFGGHARLHAQPESVGPWSIVELRQYTLHPGKRDVLVDLFDAEFVETQEAVGMKIVGQFRDLDKPDRFVWIRAFRDMTSRAPALKAFYSGPVWATHKAVANSTMIDASDVLLLHPTAPHGLLPCFGTRPGKGATAAPSSLVAATIYSFSEPVSSQFLTFFERTLQPALANAGLPVLASFVTEESPNNFPALPVRERENVFVWLTKAASADEYQQRVGRLEALPEWTQAARELRSRLIKSPEVLRLQPTARSELR